MSKILIKVHSSDGEMFQVDSEIIKRFTHISNILEWYALMDVYTLYWITGMTFRKVLTWVEHHMNNPEPEEGSETEKELSSWDADFFQVSPDTLKDITFAAQYLGVKDLMAKCGTLNT